MNQKKPVIEITLPRGRHLDFSKRALVMGIINCTPDSFYPESRANGVDQAVEAGLRMIESGADILDIGGESTRPGSEFVSDSEELERVVPVISKIRTQAEIALSVDTRKSSVAQAAIDAGADIINDVSGLRDDPFMAGIAARTGVPVVIMHMRGTPKTMQKNPHYHDPVREVCSQLSERVRFAIEEGIEPDCIILDPGIGFGKRLEDNLALIRGIATIRALGFPILLGASRKSFIESVLERPVGERLAGTLAVEAFAILQGVEILRVHDVSETVDMVRMIAAIHRAPA